MIKGIKLLGFKGWLWWKKEELTYKFKQRRYRKAVEVLDELKSIKDLDVFFNSLGMHIGNLKKELHGKKYKNTMWYCHD